MSGDMTVIRYEDNDMRYEDIWTLVVRFFFLFYVEDLERKKHIMYNDNIMEIQNKHSGILTRTHFSVKFCSLRLSLEAWVQLSCLMFHFGSCHRFTSNRIVDRLMICTNEVPFVKIKNILNRSKILHNNLSACFR